MKVGDLVHNVPYDKYGVILSDPRSIHDAEGRCAEQVFSILWEDGSIHSAGSTLLDVVVAVTDDQH